MRDVENEGKWGMGEVGNGGSGEWGKWGKWGMGEMGNESSGRFLTDRAIAKRSSEET